MFIEYLEQPSIDKIDEVLPINNESSWMDPIIQYLTDEILPKNLSEIKRLRWMALQYILMNGQLYKKLFFLPLLKCLRPTDTNYVLREVHKEIYRNHLRSKSLAYKVL